MITNYNTKYVPCYAVSAIVFFFKRMHDKPFYEITNIVCVF